MHILRMLTTMLPHGINADMHQAIAIRKYAHYTERHQANSQFNYI